MFSCINNRICLSITVFIISFFIKTPQSYSAINSIMISIESLDLNKLPSNQFTINKDFIANPTLFTSYGPLAIDMNNIKYKNSIFFIPALNDKSKPLFLAVYCYGSLINVKGSNAWKGWREAFYSFENNLVKKLCPSVDKY